MSDPEILVRFVLVLIRDEELSHSEVAKIAHTIEPMLGVEVWVARHKVPEGFEHSWAHGPLKASPEFTASEQLDKLLDRLDPASVKKLVQEFGFEVCVSVVGYYYDSTPELAFTPDQIRKIYELGAHFDIDIYRLSEEENG